MSRRRSFVFIAVAVLFAHSVRAQDAAPVSTMSGVFTEAQAERGRNTYSLACASCHTPASHSGTSFTKSWIGKLLSELLGLIKTTMPETDPGSLSATQYADVVAYLLRLNGMPAGAVELQPDSASFKLVVIDTVRVAPDILHAAR